MFKAENHSETCWNLDFFYIHAYKKNTSYCLFYTHVEIHKTWRKFELFFYIHVASC